jgi:hypothetical protein
MVEDESLVALQAPPRLDPDVRLIGPGRQRGDGLVHDVWLGLRQGRLREYAPPGVALRGLDGALTVHEEHRRAWHEGCAQFMEKAQRLYAAAPACVPRIWRVSDGTSGAWLIGAPSGEPLARALAPGATLPPTDVMRMAGALADALATIHALGILNLDVAPETVTFVSGRVMLSDFAVDNRAFLGLLGSEEGLVRPGYSPIELYDGGMAEPLGPATDIYAASALLYRLMTGTEPPPWQERWRANTLLPLANSAVYPPAFTDAIRRGLAIEPGERFADALAWKNAMGVAAAPADPGEGWIEEAGAAASGPDERSWYDTFASPPPAARPSRRAGWLVVAIIAAFGLATLLATSMLLRPPAAASEAPAALYRVTGPANARSAPSPTASVVARFRSGDQVTGVMTASDSGEPWLRITDGPHSGAFVWARNLAAASSAASVAEQR